MSHFTFVEFSFGFNFLSFRTKKCRNLSVTETPEGDEQCSNMCPSTRNHPTPTVIRSVIIFGLSITAVSLEVLVFTMVYKDYPTFYITSSTRYMDGLAVDRLHVNRQFTNFTNDQEVQPYEKWQHMEVSNNTKKIINNRVPKQKVVWSDTINKI